MKISLGKEAETNSAKTIKEDVLKKNFQSYG